jgi:inorganic pyrophosphatase
MPCNPIAFQEGATKPIELDAVVEVPRGSFLKRGSTGKVDFISPVPCPFNYGSVPQYLGREGDLLDAVVLGPRLPYGSHVRVKVWGAVILTDHGMSDDKLICSSRPVTGADRRRLLRFFHLYAKCKGLLNFCRRRPGRNACEGGARPNRRWRVLARDRQRGKDRRLSFDNIGLRRDHDTIINPIAGNNSGTPRLSLAQTDALAKLLIEKGLITRKEFMQKISEERATYQKLLNPTRQ